MVAGLSQYIKRMQTLRLALEFNKADKNTNQKLTKKELSNRIKDSKVDKAVKADLQKALTNFDVFAGSDKQLSFAEFRKAATATLGSSHIRGTASASGQEK